MEEFRLKLHTSLVNWFCMIGTQRTIHIVLDIRDPFQKLFAFVNNTTIYQYNDHQNDRYTPQLRVHQVHAFESYIIQLPDCMYTLLLYSDYVHFPIQKYHISNRKIDYRNITVYVNSLQLTE